jgi:hypothetical protein
MADPPSVVGADQLTVAEPSPAVADTLVGGLGTVSGVTVTVGLLGKESPTEFVATTAKVYEVPLVRPEHVAVVPEMMQAPPTGEEVTL